METTDKSVEILNDLIEINNDRIAGFEHASKGLESNDLDLKAIFDDMQAESAENVQELSASVNAAGSEVESGTSASGTIHRTWLDVKATFSGHDRKSILDECERGEDVIKKAYKSALDADSGLSSEYYELVASQQQGINAAHDKIKALRDSQA